MRAQICVQIPTVGTYIVNKTAFAEYCFSKLFSRSFVSNLVAKLSRGTGLLVLSFLDYMRQRTSDIDGQTLWEFFAHDTIFSAHNDRGIVVWNMNKSSFQKILEKFCLRKFPVWVILDTFEVWRQSSRSRARITKGRPAFRDRITKGNLRIQNRIWKVRNSKTEKIFDLFSVRVFSPNFFEI